MSDLHCFRCNRRLPIKEPPKRESVVITCPRCHMPNVVGPQKLDKAAVR